MRSYDIAMFQVIGASVEVDFYLQFLPAKLTGWLISICNFFPPNRRDDFYFEFLPTKSSRHAHASVCVERGVNNMMMIVK
jgi:cobalamin biosynthesis protein CobD/CbiB